MVSLIDLPEEVVKMILLEAFTAPDNVTNLLKVSRGVRSRLHDVLVERPPSFHSQLSFFEWLNKLSEDRLKKVMYLTINVHDVDFGILLESDNFSNQQFPSPRLLTSSLYDAELDAFRQAFRRIPNLKMLTIQALSDDQTDLYRAFLSRLLGGLGVMCPELTFLGLEGIAHHRSLAFLKDLRKLKSFSFDWCCSIGSLEIAYVLASLNNLRALSVVSHQPMISPPPHQQNEFLEKSPSFVAQNLETISTLR